MFKKTTRLPLLAAGFCLVTAIVALAQPKKQEQEQERKVKQSEVPRAAMETLKKMAGSNPITEFSEEIEHGHKFYEGSWAGPNGHIDVLVTETGDLVEIEEAVAVDSLPAEVKAAAGKMAGKGANMRAEKKTSVHYEVKFSKDGKWQEVLFTPDGRVSEHEEKAGQGDED